MNRAGKSMHLCYLLFISRNLLNHNVRIAAVQHERDKISNRRSFYDAPGLNGALIDISTLLCAEVESKESAEPIEAKKISSSGPLTLSDICSAFKVHLFRLINWAKQLECFSSLDMQDQVNVILKSLCA